MEQLAQRGADGVTVSSAGTGAWEGAPASEGAYLVGLENGLDLSGHKARLLTRDIVRDAQIILTMSRHHRTRVQDLGGEGRVFLLGEFTGLKGNHAEVSDPFGSDIDTYRDTYDQLQTLIQQATYRLLDQRTDQAD